MYPYKIELWDAINEYAESCGGDTTDKTARRPSRQKAVVVIESVIEKICFAAYHHGKPIRATCGSIYDDTEN
jgi:hypothetical protein